MLTTRRKDLCIYFYACGCPSAFFLMGKEKHNQKVPKRNKKLKDTLKYACLWKITKGELLKRSRGHLGRSWDCATSTANEYSWILKVSVGPCGVLATFRYCAVLVFDNIRKCVTPKGPATFKKSLRLCRLFSCKNKHKAQISKKPAHKKV